jgi:hypothetical protein
MGGPFGSVWELDNRGVDENEAEFVRVAEDVQVEFAVDGIAGALEFVRVRHARGENGLIQGSVEIDQHLRQGAEERKVHHLLADEVGTAVFAGEAIPGRVAPDDAEVSVDEIDDRGVQFESGPGQGIEAKIGDGFLQGGPRFPE